ncbi:DUF1659 domain-containing protein [Desulfosporosinus nitroreducens]|uniref:DUF1659 domain-containing protein n=1 Tax=Desulfosporosinus nitroreducens TaxID=2018668 RepID=A0ABT8QWG7_9FIRM|nr:DUF1659 domain-containing protein [Desulfosporosinus nitroreducens]MCO1600948.1 DUF1659 domain-containing protein [Desulfosporosinus nitroreducens]MDO0825683.1 DUF1659 domain-containing protein [Desulfosporosinus nitroreducens]
MAVIASSRDSVIVITIQTGQTPQGAPILRQRSLSNVRATATDQDVYDIAAALYGLQDHSLIGVRRDNRVDLVEA